MSQPVMFQMGFETPVNISVSASWHGTHPQYLAEFSFSKSNKRHQVVHCLIITSRQTAMRIRKFTTCVLLSCIASLTVPVFAQEVDSNTPPASEIGFFDALSNGRIKALFRYSGQYRDSNLHLLQDSSTPEAPDEKVQQYSAIGGFFGYETAPWRNTTFGATVYGAVPFGNNPSDRRGLGGLYEEDADQDAYAALGELYLKYQANGHLLKVGRTEMPDYRFVSLSNIRFSPITHSGAVYENRVKEGLGVNLGYIMKMKERNAKKFIDMARGARLHESDRGKQLIRGAYDPDDYNASGYIGDNKEMTMLGVTYQKDAFSFEAWDYYINDFLNTLYLLGQYRIEPASSSFYYVLAAQYTNQQDVGSHIAGNIDTWHYGLSVRAYSGALSFFGNYNRGAYNENSYDGGTIFVRWGTPQMFNSFQVQDSELAGTRSVGVGLQYDFGRNGLIPGVVMRWRYGDYNLPDKLTMTDARQDRREATFDLRYSFTQTSDFGIFTEMKGWSLQFRLAFNNYRTDYDFEAYRDIHGYNFESATKDFIDARLYLDYIF